MIRPVPLTNFTYPTLKREGLPCRPGCQIAVHKRVISSGLLWLEFRHKRISQSPHPGLKNGAGVMGDKPGKAYAPPAIPYPPCTVQRMKSRRRQRRRIPYVMKVCRCHKQVVIIGRDSCHDSPCLLGNLSDMTPAIPQGRQQPFRVCSGPRCQGHAYTVLLMNGTVDGRLSQAV
jgi:hypothetical protein